MRFKIVVRGQNLGADELLRENLYEIKQIFGRVVADVIDRIRRQRQTVLAVLLFRRVLHDTLHALDDIVNEREIPLAVSVIEDLDRLAL